MSQQLFLGRSDEQRRFEAVLESLVSATVEGNSPVMLVQGLGGMGKTELLGRYSAIAEQATTGSTAADAAKRPVVVSVNFEDERGKRDAYPSSTGPELLTVLAALQAACLAAFGDSAKREKQAKRAFASFAAAADQVSLARDPTTGVAAEGDRQSPAVEGAAKLAEAAAALSGVPVPAGGIVEAVGIAARERRRRSHDDLSVLDVRYRPEEALAEAFAASVRALSAERPIVFVLDTYEIVAKIGGWLRSAMQGTGGRTAWVVAGRLEAAAAAGESSDAAAFSRELAEDSLRIINMARFADGTISELLARRNVPNIDQGLVNMVAAVTRGVPLAVDLVAGLLARGVDLTDVVSPVDDAGDSTHVVTELATRYLKHARDDEHLRADIPYLYGLALARADKTDPPLLQAIWGTDTAVATQLDDLAERHDFVLTQSRRLHVDVRDTFRSYLLDAARRAQTRDANERAAALLHERLARIAHPTVEDQLEDDAWRSTAAALVWHDLWIDNDRGLERLLDIFPSAALLHRPFAHELVGVASFFVETFSASQQVLLRGMSSLLSFGAFLDGWLTKRREALMRNPAVMSLAGSREEPTDTDRQASLQRMATRVAQGESVVAPAPSPEAVVSLLAARSAARTDPERAVQALERAADGVPADGRRLARELGETARELTGRLVFEPDRAGKAPSPDGLQAARLAARYEDTAGSRISLGLAFSKLKRDAEAVDAYDGLLERFGSGGDDETRRQVAIAQYNKGVVLGRLQRIQDAIDSYDELIEQFGQDPDPELRRQTAKALNNKAIDLGQLDRPDEAIAVWGDLVERFRDDDDAETRRETAKALNNKAIQLGRLDRTDEAIAIWGDLVERFGDDADAETRHQTAIAQFNRGIALGHVDQPEGAIDAYDEFWRRFSADPDPELRRQSAEALNNKAAMLQRLGREQDALDVADMLIEQYAGDGDDELRHLTAIALNNKAAMLGGLGRAQDALDVWDDLLERFGDDPEPELRLQTARALSGKGIALMELERLDDAVRVYDTLCERVGDDPDPELRRETMIALFNSAHALGKLDRTQDAVDAYDTLISRFGEGTDPDMRLHTATAMNNRGVALGKLDGQKAVDAYDELVGRFGDDDAAGVPEQVAMALRNKGIALGKLDRHQDAIDAYDDVVSRFGDDPSPELRRRTANALQSKAFALRSLARPLEAIDVYDDVLTRVGDDPTPELRRHAAHALQNKGAVLGELARYDDAIEIHDDLVRRYGEDPDPELRRRTAIALNVRAVALGRLRRPLEAIATYDELLTRVGDDADPELRRQTAIALNNKGAALEQLDKEQEVYVPWDDLVGRFGDDPHPELRFHTANALVNRGIALHRHGELADAMDLYDAMIAHVGDDPDPRLRRSAAIALLNRGVALRHLARPLDAIGVYDALVARDGGKPDLELRRNVVNALNAKSMLLAELDRPEETLASWDELLQHVGDDPELRPHAAFALQQKGVVLSQLDRLEDAIGMYDELIERFGNDPDGFLRRHTAAALINKALVLRRGERPDDAIGVYDELIERLGDDPDPEILRCTARALRGKVELVQGAGGIGTAPPELLARAERSFELASAARPDDALLLGEYALFVSALPDGYERAEALFERAIAADPADANNLANHARLVFERGETADAVALAERALAAAGPKDRPAVAEVSIYLLALGPDEHRAAALRTLGRLIDDGVRSPSWDFSRVLARARERNVLDPLTELLAAVVSGDAEPDVLAGRPDWPS